MDKATLQDTEMLDSDDSFVSAYETHAPSVYRFLLWRTKDIQTAEDLTSTTFAKAWIHRQSFHGGSVQAWLYRIARNALTDHWRKRKDIALDNIEILPVEPESDIAEQLDQQTQIIALQHALSRLPKQMQQVLTLRFIEGMSCKQVAKKLHISEGNVRIIQYRALKQMRGYLE